MNHIYDIPMKFSHKVRQTIAIHKDKKINSHALIFESDDWGSIRVPSSAIHDYLIRIGYRVDTRPYEHLDGLERSKDIDLLSKTLLEFTDTKGNHPIFTLNYLSSNPKFTDIKRSKYQEYKWEPIDITYQSYDQSNNVISLVKDGIESGIFEIQYHGREHFNVKQWLKALQDGDQDVHTAFELQMCGIFPKENPSLGNQYMIAFNDDHSTLENIIQEGITEFQRIWGRRANSFIAPCYTWHPSIEEILYRSGIKIIQGSRFQKIPSFTKTIVHWMGERNRFNQIYTIRNCKFEPSTSNNIHKVVDDCISEIRYAFSRNLPAIISTHRINYTSRLSTTNPIQSINLLRQLLNRVLTEFPDVEFKTGTQLYSDENSHS